MPLDKIIEVEGDIKEELVNTVSVKDALRNAKENRIEIKKILKRKEIASKLVNVANTGDKPIVSTNAKYQYQNPYFSELNWVNNYSLGVATFPLFDGFLTEGKIKQSEAELNSADIDLKILSQNSIRNKSSNACLEESMEHLNTAKILVSKQRNI